MSLPTPERKRDEIVRYTPATRINHWIVAISFVLIALSGLALFHPAFFWLANLFGGGTWTRILHPFIGLVLIIAFCLLGAKMWGDNRMQRHDWAWLKRFRDVAADREESVPAPGRYNAGQKLIYWIIVVCLPLLLLSGIVIWRSYFAEYFPVGLTRFAGLLHSFVAFVLIIAIVIHIYAAIWVRGSVRAMTRGTVSYGWAWKHHRQWFRDAVKGEAPPK